MVKRLAGFIVLAALLSYALYIGPSMVSGQLETPNNRIVYIPKTIDQRVEFWQVMNQGVLAAAKEFNAQVTVIGTEKESDIDGQIRVLEEAILQKPKAIILAATDYNRLVPAAQKAVQAGILLITVDSALNGDTAASFIATDNYTAGQKAGQALRKWVPDGGNVAIINFVEGSATAMEREQGVRDSLKTNGRDMLHVVDTFYSGASEEKAYELTIRLLKEQPGLDGIIGLNEPSAVGAGRAIKDLGMSHQIKLIGFDSSMDEVAFLEDGTMQATVVQKPFTMGYLAVQTAIQTRKGKEVRRIDTGSEVITKQDMYTNENQKLLFPFVEK
ncbi:substrate-binding domain-containing protein [Paenibacillus rigui]|uniref:LacI family transcriptional regulator n=1 Tax=Paenibacillus rigui TaxID=554312 RepID=A0A229URQ1_9BACL|nr:substrate-binding domain-containing protein [Paenibacillus rigui]OXM86186.1 LacI family transcriptional regulator [Paenibacillus rigui]